MLSPLEQFDVIKVINLKWIFFDFSLSNIVLPLFLINIFFIFLFFCLKNNSTVIPTIWQYILEYWYKFVLTVLKQEAGLSGCKYFPFIFLMFNFIFLCNIISLVPYGVALTSHFVLILYLSITICSSIFFIGLLVNKLKFLKIFIPECPFILLPIIIPIELFSYVLRMFSLAIRLAANILAGHTLVYILSSFALKLFSLNVCLYVLAFVPLFFVLILEFGVAFLQAYVFTFLVCIYLSDSLNLVKH